MSIHVSFFALATALALGCGGASSNSNDDMPKADLAAKLSCYAIAECGFECIAGDAACVDTCIADGTTDAQTAYATLATCGYGVCAVPDGGAPMSGTSGACATATDSSAVCTQCVQNAIQSPTCASFVTTCASQ